MNGPKHAHPDTPITNKIIDDADACPETRVVFLIKHLVNQCRAFERAQRAEGLPRMEVLREKIGQAAYEWQQYVDTDHAPRNLVDHMEAAFDAATKGPNGG